MDNKYKEIAQLINDNIGDIEEVRELIKICPILNSFYIKTLNDFSNYIESQSRDYIIDKVQS